MSGSEVYDTHYDEIPPQTLTFEEFLHGVVANFRYSIEADMSGDRSTIQHSDDTMRATIHEYPEYHSLLVHRLNR